MLNYIENGCLNKTINISKLKNIVLPFYKDSRLGDDLHIEWLLHTIESFSDLPKKEEILLLALFHDIGYSKFKTKNPFSKESRQKHSFEGSILTKKILIKQGYKKKMIDRIVFLVLHHDDWAISNLPNDTTLRIFNDFDFMWMYSKQGLEIVRKFKSMTQEEFKSYLKKEFKEHNFWNENIRNHCNILLRKL